MDVLEKIALSAQAAEHEVEGEHALKPTHTGSLRDGCGMRTSEIRLRYGDPNRTHILEIDGHKIHIHLAAAPGGRRVPLLKSMLTTACERDCRYCSFRAGRNFQRITFTPDDLASTFFRLHQVGGVEGLFLSAGVLRGGANMQNRLLDAVEILRHKLGYEGYLHLKIMPGAERGQVLKAMQLADRVSVNLEAPNQARLSHLAPTKCFSTELLSPLRWIEEIRRSYPHQQSWRGRWPSSSTQFVVGAAGESDLEIMSTVAHITQSLGLSRAYFEAFEPVPGTPLENHPAENPLRQHRLYQASFLIRDYGFDLEDLPFKHDGRLPLGKDPKRIAAEHSLSDTPIEINHAGRHELLRVPGIGPRSAAAILETRREYPFRELGDLRRAGALAERAAPYITLNGHRPPRQMTMF
jgi:predicted DNA-binding helix-hairpin-helix protein